MNHLDWLQNYYFSASAAVLATGIFWKGFRHLGKAVQFVPSVIVIILFVKLTDANSKLLQALAIFLIVGMILSASSKLTRAFAYSSLPYERWNSIRWISSSFMHSGVVHLATNIFSLHVIYRVAEQKYSDLQLVKLSAVLIIVGCIIRSFLEKFIRKTPQLSVGASAWICGWFGVLAIQFPNLKFVLTGNLSIRYGVLGLLISSVFLAFLKTKDGIDHLGHATGIVAGITIGMAIPYIQTQLLLH